MRKVDKWWAWEGLQHERHAYHISTVGKWKLWHGRQLLKANILRVTHLHLEVHLPHDQEPHPRPHPPFGHQGHRYCHLHLWGSVKLLCKNSISEMTNGWVWWSGVKSGCPESEWVRVGGTWLQLMCCAILHRRVPNFGRRGQIGYRRFRDDFVVKDRSQTKVTRREIQVVEQEEDLRDKCSERTMSKISRDSN